MRRFLILLSLLAVVSMAAAEPLTPDSVYRRLDSMPLHRIEGIWQMTDASAVTIVVWRAADSRESSSAVPVYDVLLLKAPDRSRMPGELLGQMRPTARPDCFDCTINTRFDKKGNPTKSMRYTVEVVDDAHLSFKPVHHGVRISPVILLPPMLRRGIHFGSDRDKGLDGAIKVYPEVPVKGRPRYL